MSDFLDNVDWWLVLGFAAQAVFSARFVVQWIYSERARESVVPIPFWYLSFLGGSMLLVYAIKQRDPVFILGQSTGVLIYLRNLLFIYQKKKCDT